MQVFLSFVVIYQLCQCQASFRFVGRVSADLVQVAGFSVIVEETREDETVCF